MSSRARFVTLLFLLVAGSVSAAGVATRSTAVAAPKQKKSKVAAPRGDASASADPPVREAPPPAPAPTPEGPHDVLSVARPKVDDASRGSIGTCDPLERDDTIRFGLAHFNDLQARYSDVVGGRSRYAYLAGYLRQLKSEQPTLVLDAGNDYEKGALAELRSSGETTRQMVQALPIDARTIGNQDFAYGEVAVMRDVGLSRHPVLAANVRHSGLSASKQPFRPYVRFDVGCVKVGVIGLVTENLGPDNRPTSTPYDGVFVQDPQYHAILEREARAHRGEVDVLIALTHLGYAEDVALARRGGRLVDFIVGGHSGDQLDEPGVVVHPDNTKTFVLQAGRFGEAIGHGEVVVTPKAGGRGKVSLQKYRLVDVDEKLPVAADVDDLAKRLQATIVPDVHAPVGRLSAAVPKGRPVAELVYRAAAATWAVDALVVGRDLFSAGLPKGEVTLQRLYAPVLVQRQPAGTSGASSLWVAELSGAELTALARAFRAGGSYDWFGAKGKLDPAKRYRLALDKRGVTFSKALFGPAAKMLQPVFLGEMIDALELYARARTASGQTID